MKYVRKPEVVKAVQWDGTNHYLAHLLPGNVKIGWLNTPDGGRSLTRGQWILEDEAGRFTVLSSEVFKVLYQQVT